MKQLDVVRNPRDGGHPLWLILQSDTTDYLRSVVVAPIKKLSDLDGERVDHLEPVIRVGDEPYIVLLHKMASVHRDSIGGKVESVHRDRWADIQSGIDLLFAGF